ncbi:MAG: DNA polymerase I, partial [Pseudomonadota bacterium]
EYGSLDALVSRAAEVKGKLGDNLRAALTELPLYRQLTTIRCDLKLKETVDDLRPGEADREKLAALYKRMGFNRWLEELKSEAPESGHPRPSTELRTGSGGDPATTVETTAPLDSCLRGNDEPVKPVGDSPKTRAETVLDETAFAAMLRKLEAAPLICLDTETDSLDSQQARIVGLSFAAEPGHGWYVPLAHRYLGVPKQLEMKSVLARLKPILEDASKPKLGQHIKYDLNVLHHHGIDVAGVDYDTMLESFVVDAGANRHDMDTLALKYLSHATIHYEDVTGKGKSQIPFAQVSIEKAADYSAEDADITLRLHQALHPRVIAEPGLKRVFETIEMPLVPALAQIERNGVRIDTALLGRISLEFAQRMDEYQLLCWKEAGQEFNLGSPLQLQQILYEKLKLPVLGHTPKGQPSTAEDVLAELAEQHPLPRLILSWRELSKLRSTYTETLPQQVNPNTGRIHTSYHQAGAATGRLSSSDPNLQNIPVRTEEGRRIRQAFIASEGNLLLSIDYSQIELRLMAHLSNDPRLQEAFKKGLDIHQATAAEVLGLPLEQVTSEQRRSAKAVNFGLIYGMSAFGLAKQLGIARGEAGDYMTKFFERYAGVKTFMDETKEKARTQGYVETLFGRRLYLPNIKSKNQAQRGYAERTAINAPLQGTAADLIKLTMIDLHAFLLKEKSPVLMIMQVHDELVFEGPAKTVTQLAPLLAERMCRVTRLNVPLVADWGIGNEWNQAHSPQGHASH